MHARITTIQGDPSQAEEAIAIVQNQVIPGAKGMQGFAGGYWALDRETGRMLAMTLWESEDAMAQSEEMAASLREESTSQLDGEIASVERFEIVAQA